MGTLSIADTNNSEEIDEYIGKLNHIFDTIAHNIAKYTNGGSNTLVLINNAARETLHTHA